MMDHSLNKPLEKVHGHSLAIVRLIAVGKILKGICLLVVGGLILHTIRMDATVHDVLKEFINALKIDENGHFIHSLLERSLGVNPKLLPWLSLGTLIYAIIYFVEGLGLLWDKVWAEWMVIVTTAGFIPLEIYEIYEHTTVVRVVVLILNVAALVYIALRLRWRHLARLEAKERGVPYVSPHQTTRSGIKP